MQLNAETLKDCLTGFTSLYSDAILASAPFYEQIAMTTISTGSEEKYGWLGAIPELREWLGERVINNLKNHGYTIENKEFEGTVAVKRTAIEDDKIGIYAPMFRMLGQRVALHPDTLIFNLLKNAFSTLCYDGQNFIDTDHPVIDEKGVEQSVSNSGGGAGAAWFLLDTSKEIKPLIYQKRRDFQLVAKDSLTDENVFQKNEYLYGVDGRDAAGYGLWQLAYGSKQDLTAANYEAARAAMMGFKGDKGTVLNITPTLLVVGPSNEGKARRLLKALTTTNGEDNIWHGSAELLVVPYL